jgi:hypothetical protein
MLTNRSTLACTLEGCPALALTDINGRDVPLSIYCQQPGFGTLFPYIPVQQVGLKPGEAASFGIEWLNQQQPAAMTLEVFWARSGTRRLAVSPAAPNNGVPDSMLVTVTAIVSGEVKNFLPT